MKTISQYYTVPRKSLAYFKFIIEAYDGVAVMETMDPAVAVIKLRVAPGCLADAADVVRELNREVMVTPVEGTPWEAAVSVET